MFPCLRPEGAQLEELDPVRKGQVKQSEGWWWSSYNHFALGKATVEACHIQIDDVRLPLGLRA